MTFQYWFYEKGIRHRFLSCEGEECSAILEIVNEVKLIVNKWSMRCACVAQLFHVIVSVLSEIQNGTLSWSVLFVSFGQYPYCWDDQWIILYCFVMYKSLELPLLDRHWNNITRCKHVYSCINKYWFQLTLTVCVFP